MRKRQWPEPSPKISGRPNKKVKPDAQTAKDESWREHAVDRLLTMSGEEWFQEEVARMIGGRYIQFGPLDSETLELLLRLSVEEQYHVLADALESELNDAADFDDVLWVSLTGAPRKPLHQHRKEGPLAASLSDRSAIKKARPSTSRSLQQQPTPQPPAVPPVLQLRQNLSATPRTPPRDAETSTQSQKRRGSSEFTEVVQVPKEYIPKVIGKKGSTIVKIKQESGVAEIDARNQTTDPVQITIVGFPRSVEIAKKMIFDLVTQAVEKHSNSEFVEVAKDKIGMVMGRKGSNINRISEKTSTKIDVDWSSDPFKVYIAGSSENVAAAKYEILASVGEAPDQESEILEFDLDTASQILGINGSTIGKLQEESGAWVQLEEDKSAGVCRVRIRGTSDARVNATNALYDIIHPA